MEKAQGFLDNGYEWVSKEMRGFRERGNVNIRYSKDWKGVCYLLF